VNPTAPVARCWPANSLRRTCEVSAVAWRVIRASSLISLIESMTAISLAIVEV